MSTQLNYLVPIWLTWTLSAGLFAAIGYGTATMLWKEIPRKWVAILTGLRLAILLVFMSILLHPVVSHTSNVTQLPELLVLVDTSQSMGMPADTSGKTRLDETLSHLRTGDLARSLRGNYQLQWFTFDATAQPRDEAELFETKPIGATTQLGDSIEAASRHVQAIGKQPSRLLLVSDGNDRGQADPVAIARQLGVTVDVLAPTAAKRSEQPAVEIAVVQSARRVLLGSDTHFRVTLDGKAAAAKDRTLLLHVAEDGKKILDQSLSLKAGRVEQTVTLTHRPSGAGLKQYDFALDGGSAKPHRVAVQVIDSKYEVLILEDRWRWEYKYLHRLFEDDPSFRFSALLSRGGGTVAQFGSPDRRVSLIGLPQSRADLEGFDCFVLGEVDPAKWPRTLAADLARQVADDGKSLVVIAGPSLANLLDVPELHALLPVELTPESGKPLEGPIDVRLRPDGSQSPFFFQLRTGEAEKLTPLDHIYPVLRKRAGATVLVEAVKERNPYGNWIVMAEHTVGRGRVLFVGTDTLWKWHTLAANNDGPTPYSIFWQQAFRAMTPARSNVGGVNLWLTPSRSRIEVGASVSIEAEVQTSRTLPATTMQASVALPDESRVPLVFASDPANPRLFRTVFTCTQPGNHQVVGVLSADGKTLAEGAALVQADESRGEQHDLGIDHANLARIAQATGGQVVDPVRSESWPTPGDASLPSVPRVRTIDLWGNFTLMLILCSLLATDWFIRLFKGLVAG